MDERGYSARIADVSCRNIGWCFDLCASKKLDVNRVLRNVPYAREHLQNPARFIDWQSFSTFCDNFLNYLSEAEIREAARKSWDSRNMKIYRIIGYLLYSVRGQYSAAFGPMGFVAKLFPCELTMSQPIAGHLRIGLKMKSGLTPCRSFHLILAGQMTGLPASLGYSDAEVQLHHHHSGADFDVYYQPYGGFFASIRRFLSRPLIQRDSALELNRTYDSLLEKYRELQTETQKLKQTENRAAETENKYRLLANNVSDVIWTLDLNLNFQYLSPSLCHLTGYSEQEANEIEIQDLFPEESIARIKAFLEPSVQSTDQDLDQTFTFETELICKDKSRIWIENKANFILNNCGRPEHLVGVSRDISERRHIQDQLYRSEEDYRVITETAQDAIFTFDDHGYITFANNSSARIFRYSTNSLVGMSVKTIIPEAFSTSPLELEQLSNENVALTGITANNEDLSLEISFAKHERLGRFYFIGIARDLSQRKQDEIERGQLQSQLLASQKMESIGQLTGGIAHDFNNLLVAINGYAELGLNKQNLDKDQTHYFSEIKLAGKRAAEMTHKLLAFSRRQIIEPSVLDLRELIDGLKSMLQRLLPESIQIEFNPESQAKSLKVLADKGQIEQILVNLAVNARDSMPQGGDLTITCHEFEIKDDFIEKHSDARLGTYAVIQVEDSGFGMSDEVQKRIFEPFFTTKPEGLGTGLGLSVVFGITKQHNGFVTINSEAGKGSVFKVFLPKAEGQVREPKAPFEVTTIGGHESILIVEDNRQVRDLACIILKEAGYQVFSAVDGLEAISTFREFASKIDLVILDVVMPRMGGLEVLQKMQTIKPDIKVIFTSGYSNQGIHTNFILERGLEFIQKPYHPEWLRKKIRSVLDKSSTIDSQQQVGLN